MLRDTFTRDDIDATIKKLVEHYPRCFILDPRSRLPIANNILLELENDGFPAEYNLLRKSVGFYTGHLGYLHTLISGNKKRFNLKGEVVGSVTEDEADNARLRIAEIQERRAEAGLISRNVVDYSPPKFLVAKAPNTSDVAELKHVITALGALVEKAKTLIERS